MLDYDTLPAEIRRFYSNSRDLTPFPRTIKGKRYKCDYCGSELLEQEIHNGTCPNCSAPIDFECKKLKINIREIAGKMLEKKLVKCPQCGTVYFSQKIDDYGGRFNVHTRCKCGRRAGTSILKKRLKTAGDIERATDDIAEFWREVITRGEKTSEENSSRV